MSVLGLDLGYTVKYDPLPSRVPSGTSSGKGLYLTVYPLSRPNTDRVKHLALAFHLITNNLELPTPKSCNCFDFL